MKAQNISRGQWKTSCERLTRKYARQPIRIETSCRETCSIYQMARDLPLIGIEVRSAGEPVEEIISIAAGQSPETFIVRSISGPSRLSIEVPGEGKPVTLRIETNEGIVTDVVFPAD